MVTTESIRERLTNISKEITLINKELKILEKEQAKVKKPRQTQEKVYNIKPELIDFLGMSETQATRRSILKKISQYVKDNGLQKDDDKCSFYPNEAFSKLFNIDKNKKLTFLNINSLVSPFIIKSW